MASINLPIGAVTDPYFKVSGAGTTADPYVFHKIIDSGAVTETSGSAIATSLAIMDDWDETNRAAVNLIAGQVGVQGGSGAVTALTQRVVLATDDPAVTSLALIDNLVYTEGDTDATLVGIAVMMEDSGDTVRPLQGSTTLGLKVYDSEKTTGTSIFRSIDIDETEEEIKSTAGQIFGWYIVNLASTVRFVKFYNATAAGTTVGTNTPLLTLPIPANSTSGAGSNLLSAQGIAFSTALSIAATTGVADADTGAPGANEVVGNVFYK